MTLPRILNTAQVHVSHRNDRNIFFYDDFFFFSVKMPAGVVRQKLNDIFRASAIAADAVGCYGKFVIRGNQRFCRRIVVETKLSGSDAAPVQTGDNIPAVCRNSAVDEFGTGFFVITLLALQKLSACNQVVRKIHGRSYFLLFKSIDRHRNCSYWTNSSNIVSNCQIFSKKSS